MILSTLADATSKDSKRDRQARICLRHPAIREAYPDIAISLVQRLNTSEGYQFLSKF